MNILDLTTQQLKRAASIKEQIDGLTDELKSILGVARNGAPKKNGNRLSAAARSRIAAAQKARWAKARRAAKPAAKSAGKKSSMSAAAKAKASARMKAYWKAKKAGKKTAGSGK